MSLSRRHFLATAGATGIVGLAPSLLLPHAIARASQGAATTLRVEKRVIDVLGKAANVFGIVQPDGIHGFHAETGQRFRVRLENRSGEETLIHWHGLTPPWQQDGVPSLSQPPLADGASYDYDFALARPGTNWMHSHQGLQEQRLMAAPLIVRDPAEAAQDMQEVVMLFHDFTFRDPVEILAELRGAGGNMSMGGMDHAAMGHGAPSQAPASGSGHATGMGAHLHDVEYDAFLANDRTLSDPQVIQVERGGRVRLRLINGAAATHLWLDLAGLEGRLVAVDGDPVEPAVGTRFELAIAQRLDIVIDLPREEGAWPVFAVREGDTKRTGLILATKRGRIIKASMQASQPVDAVGLALERRLRATSPLSPRAVDRKHTITITEEPGYVWKLNGAVYGEHKPLAVREGERVEITFVDQTTMSHPMHLHGHHFQVVAIGDERFAGAVRDTVLVPARGKVTIAFEANNPGKWALHCHHLYHMAAGMMTTVEYAS